MKNQFHPTTLDEAKRLFRCGLLTVPGYVYFIIKIQRRDGWEMKVNPGKFCKEYGIKRRSFYDAITKLHSHKELQFDWRTTGDIIMRFHEAVPMKTLETIPEEGLSYSAIASDSQQAGLVQNLAQPCEILHSRAKSCTAVRNIARETAETHSTQWMDDPNRYLTDIKQIHTHNALADATPLPHPECVYEEEKRELGRATDASRHSHSDQETVLGREPTHPVRDTSPPGRSIKPNNKKRNNTTEWRCPQPELKKSFLSWRAEQMVATRHQPDISTATLAAMAWADKDHARADRMFEVWMSDRTATPDFEQMSADQHQQTYEIYLRTTDKKQFFDQCCWYIHWLEWARGKHPSRFCESA